MADKLKKVLSKLSEQDQNKAKKKVKKKAKVEEPEEEEDDEEEEDEEDDDGEEPETTETNPDDLSPEEVKRLQAIEREIARLRDHGVFNAEILFQVIKVNENLDRIASVLERLGGGDGKK